MIKKRSSFNPQRGSAEWVLESNQHVTLARGERGWQITIKDCPERTQLPPGLVRERDREMAAAKSQRERLTLFSKPLNRYRFDRLGDLLEAIQLIEEEAVREEAIGRALEAQPQIRPVTAAQVS